MEELRKLEEAQAVLTLLRRRGVASDSTSDRFLANFVIFLKQPCGELNLVSKCSLINQSMPKISSALLEEASVLLDRNGCDKLGEADSECGNQTNLSGKAPGFCAGDMVDQHSPESELKNEVVIGLGSMQRANSTLEDFCRSYFMFHGMDVNKPQLVFKYLPILSFVESYIYQLDGLNEEVVKVSDDRNVVSDDRNVMALSRFEMIQPSWIDVAKFPTDSFRPLLQLLECHGLITERIIEELRSGEEYWALERKLCFALKSRQEVSAEDVLKAIHLKSFDYRVLNLLLYQLRGEKVNDLHMDFLSTSEFLVEVSDDLFDYEDDVLENSFNILRMFVRIYGASAAPAMLAKCIAEAEEKYGILLEALGPQLSQQYQRRCQEATAEGGTTNGHPFGTWSVPPVIVDEELYRSSMLNCG